MPLAKGLKSSLPNVLFLLKQYEARNQGSIISGAFKLSLEKWHLPKNFSATKCLFSGFTTYYTLQYFTQKTQESFTEFSWPHKSKGLVNV